MGRDFIWLLSDLPFAYLMKIYSCATQNFLLLNIEQVEVAVNNAVKKKQKQQHINKALSV